MKDIKLTWWNQETYDELVECLKTENRCAISNATGTGKTSIICKYIHEHKNNGKVFIVAPNYDILCQYHSDFYGLNEINDLYYYTFHHFGRQNKKNNLDLEEYKNIKILILDELHRSGALTFLPAIEKLIENNPGCKIIGSSATPKRYDQEDEDMIDVLFSGNRVGRFDLETSITSGVLNFPTYVSTLYSIVEDKENIIKQLNESKMKENKKKEIIEKLEVACIDWEKSYGVDKIIKKYLSYEEDKNYKILIFCKNIASIENVRSKFDPIFESVYKNCSIGEYHSDTTDKDYEYFCTSDLKEVNILYTVNKLNEGVHIDGINAIIMLRDTQSEVVYYQQLGRVLSISGASNPIVIDMVNNCDNIEGYKFINGVICNNKNLNNEDGKDNIEIKFIDLIRDIQDVFNSLKINKKYWYNGEYNTILYFAKKYNRPYNSLSIRIKNSMTVKEAIETTDELVTINYNGEEKDLLDICNKNNLKGNYDLIKYRLENGFSFDKILMDMKGFKNGQ